MSSSLTRLLVGRSIPNREAEGQKIGVLSGIAAMGLDGLGSAAYGPEAALTVLSVAGPAGLGAMRPIVWVILLLLAILYFSYRQTIAAYPSNGGSYVVAKENLGTNAGLLAASALMLDYMLNVAVGISAGVAALTSAVPALQRYTLPLCLGTLCAVTLLNLRGTRETGAVFAVPTYLFIASLGGMLAWGMAKLWIVGDPRPVIAPPSMPKSVETIGTWLLLRAFASGCTAMTGVEAVSNGVSAFREPTVRNAHGTLTGIVAVLALLLLGIAQVTHGYGIMAMDQTKPGYQSVLSQIVGAVYGRGWLYYVTIGSVLAVLCLSANTSFVGFPRLCHLVAADDYLPRPFAMPGRRLVYSFGILFLAAGSGALLTAFGGITDRLIPLFAVGAFLSFTLSQAGMAVHWRRSLADAHATGRASVRRLQLAINGTGAVATAAALVIILAAKFTEGAWLTIIVVPAAVSGLHAIRRYYDNVDRHLLRGSTRRIDIADVGPPIAFVPIARWDRLSRKAIDYALRFATDVRVVHVTTLQGPEADREQDSLRRDWHELVEQPASAAGRAPPRLLLIPSQYRSIVAPLLRALEDVTRDEPRRPVLIVLPELVDARWWGWIMHIHRERKLRSHLLRYGGPNVSIMSVPWQLERHAPQEGVAKEEA